MALLTARSAAFLEPKSHLLQKSYRGGTGEELGLTWYGESSRLGKTVIFPGSCGVQRLSGFLKYKHMSRFSFLRSLVGSKQVGDSQVSEPRVVGQAESPLGCWGSSWEGEVGSELALGELLRISMK